MNDEVKLYSSGALVSAATYMSGVKFSAGSMYVSNGGTVENASAYSKGKLYVSSGGLTSSATLRGGDQYVSNGGVASRTVICSGGWMEVLSGGFATSTYVSSGGWMIVSSGGSATGICAPFGAKLIFTIASNTLAQGEFLSSSKISGYEWIPFEYRDSISDVSLDRYRVLLVANGGTATRVGVGSFTSMYVSDGGIANNTDVHYSGTLYVSSGGIANDTFVERSGDMTITDGGQANRTTVDWVGDLVISQGGVANSTYITSGGRMVVSSGGTATAATVSSGGSMTVEGGGSATNAVIDSGAFMRATLASDTLFQGTSNGSAFEYRNYAENIRLNSNLELSVSRGGVVNNIEIVTGNMVVYDGGIANSATTGSKGVLHISSGGVANDAYLHGMTESNGLLVYAGGVARRTFVDGAIMDLYGGFAESTTVNNGQLVVFDGGFAKNTLIGSWCEMYVSSGGSAEDVAVNGVDFYQGKGKLFLTGGTAKNVLLNGGVVTLISGGALNGATVTSGSLYVSSGGVLNGATIASGSLDVYGGTATGFAMESGTLTLDLTYDTCLQGTYGKDAVVMKNACLSGGTLHGYTNVYANAAVASATVNSTTLLLRGGTVMDTTVCGTGKISAWIGTASRVIVNSGGKLEVDDSGTASDTVVNSGGSMKVYGTATRTTVNGGVYIGGSLTDTVVNSGGTVCFATYGGGGTLRGSLQIANGGVIAAHSSATIDFTVAEQSAPATALVNNWSLISNGASANYTITVKSTQASGTYVLANGAGNFNQTITLKNTFDTELGTLTVGQTQTIGNRSYTLAKNGGTLMLTIQNGTPIRAATITVGSEEKVYDGEALTADYDCTGLLEGDTLTATVNSLTDAGSVASTITDYAIMRGEVDVTGEYGVYVVNGNLTVTPRDLTLTSKSATKEYDGTALVETTVTADGFAAYEGASYDVTGSQTAVGTSKNTFNYTFYATTKASNYNVTQVFGDLTVTPERTTVSDYNKSGKSDMIQFVNGLVYVTHDTSSGYVQTPAINDVTGWSVTEIRRDLTGDGYADIQITAYDGASQTWVATLRNDYLSTGCITLNYQFIGAYETATWSYLGSADFNADGKSEILMIQTEAGKDPYGHRNVVGWVTDTTTCQWIDNIWLGALDDDWNIAGTADVTGDGADNVLLRRSDGMIGYWDKAGTNNIVTLKNAGNRVLLTTGDFDGDGTQDFLWKSLDDNQFSTWTSISGTLSDTVIGKLSDLGGNWQFAGVGDYNGDKKDEILWCDTTTYKTAYGEATKAKFAELTVIV